MADRAQADQIDSRYTRMTDEMLTADVPALVPARMVNEFTYCPRLFHIEWVQALFEGNADTAEGSWQHRAVDRAAGRVPPPEQASELRRATAVMIGSENLGVVAVIDLLEADNGKVVPVDTKKGRPPAHGPAWEPEMVQLCVQGLLLRENGYECTEGQLYFAETRERRTIGFDDDLVARTRAALAGLRQVAASPEPPAPLVDSPKCPRCSLVGICLPDETNALADRSLRSPRRLTPRHDAARPMYVTEQGAYAGLRDGRVRVTQGRDNVIAEARLIDVSQVNLYGNAQISTQLVRECFRREVPVLWFSYGGWFSGMAEGLPGKNVELRRRQAGVSLQAGLPVARRMVNGKIRNARTLLMRNSRERDKGVVESMRSLAEQALSAPRIESLLGVEGTAARLYFGQFSSMIRDDLPFDFEGRNRRPPKDPVNCLLSYVYSLIIKDLTAITFGVGFDPYVGFFHRPRFGRPALALDLAEEFRPLIGDSVVVSMINNGEVRLHDFTTRSTGVSLTDDGRRAVLRAYERRLETEVTHPTFGYKVSYRRVMEVQARLLAAYVMGEVPDYVAFATR